MASWEAGRQRADMSRKPHRLSPPRFVLAGLLSLVAFGAGAAEMPEDFVYLRDIDPTILQDMRYAGRDNFTGAHVPGYEAPECVLVRQAAEALKRVQADLRGKPLTLKVYDCYRPARAVAAFVAWAKEPDDPHAKTDLLPQSAQGRPVPRLHRHPLRPFARRDSRCHARADR